MDLHVFPILNPPPTYLPIPLLYCKVISLQLIKILKKERKQTKEMEKVILKWKIYEFWKEVYKMIGFAKKLRDL